MDMPITVNSPYYIHWACLQKDEIAVRSILNNLENPAELLFKEDLSHGWIPMLWAAHAGSVSCMRALHERGTPTTFSSARLHQTALHVAADACRVDATLWLLSVSQATPVNTKDYLGETSLHKAARRGHQHILEILYRHGADFSLHNNTGLTAIELARQCGHESLADQMRAVVQCSKPAEDPLPLSTTVNPRKRSNSDADSGYEEMEKRSRDTMQVPVANGVSTHQSKSVMVASTPTLMAQGSTTQSFNDPMSQHSSKFCRVFF